MSYKTFNQLKKKKENVPKVSIPLTNQKHLEKLLKTGKIVVVKCWAPWCQPCLMIANDYEKLAAKNSNIIFCNDNIDNEESYHRDKVTAVPTFYFYANGNITKITGADWDIITDHIKKLLNTPVTR